MTSERTRQILTTARRSLQQVIALAGWSVLYFGLVMIAMTGVIRVATGWDTVVITSGSMSPTLRPGDVVFIDEHPEELIGQQAVITFRAPDGELITHRVFATDEDTESYVTKGDANPTPDSDLVKPNDVVGVSWLVVPYLGLPTIWWSEGNIAPLAALALLAVFAAVNMVLAARRGTSLQREDIGERLTGSAQRGIMRVRFIVALLIVMLLFVNSDGTKLGGADALGTPTLVAALVALAAVSVTAMFRARRTNGASTRRIALLELGADTVIVVVFVAASGASSIGWVLMALPIIEAAISFRLTGAFLHWIIMSSLSIAALFWSNRLANAPQSVSLTNLEQLVDRLGVLLLVVIPASYLAEQLLGDVATQRRATQTAHERSTIIERVTDAGLDVARLGVDVFPTLANAATDMGFDCADCWTGDGVGEWRRLAASSKSPASLPAPRDPAGTMRHDDLQVTEVFLDLDDVEEAAVASLAAADLGVIIRLTLMHRDSVFVVLRVGAKALSDDPVSQVKALRLLGAQAGVALQNERLMAELKSTHAEMSHRALYDSLTGLANRQHFGNLLKEQLETDATDLTVMFLDLNGFKAVNDRLGHHVGDELLIEVARRLTEAVADVGTVARLGGDEFTVLMTTSDIDRSDALAVAIHEQLDRLFHLSGEAVSVGTSIGIAASTPEDRVGFSEMMRRADLAMYSAKAAGGSMRTRRYEPSLDEGERRASLLSDSLRCALANDELELVYQPIVTGASGRIVGAEALIRWVHPELGSVPTSELLAVAESGKHIGAFNRWVIDKAITHIAVIDSAVDLAHEPPFVAVNITPTELELDELVSDISQALATNALEAHRLVIEMSERTLAEAPDAADYIEAIKATGARLALDDFGEAHTSLTHLRQLPIDFLKLDRSFVNQSVESAGDRTVLESVVRLAHDLGYSVIAEGIESIDHHTVATKAGAELAQGYALYRPMSITELAGLFGRAVPIVDSLTMAALDELTTARGEPEPTVNDSPNGTLAAFPPPAAHTQVAS